METLEKHTKDNPWELKTPTLNGSYTIHLEDLDGTEVIVCTVGKTVLYYKARAIEDLHRMLLDHGDWMELGSKDQKEQTKPNTVERWARSADNPVGGWYGLRNGFKGRFANYIPPLLEQMGLVELEHKKRGNRVRAV